MKSQNPKSFRQQLEVVAVGGEACILAGCTLLIFLHYFGSAEGLSVISTAGIILGDFVACAALHFALRRKTPLLKGSSFVIWFALTMLTAVLAAAVWMHMQQGSANADTSKEIIKLEDRLEKARRRETRQEIQKQIAALREEAGKPAFDEKSSWPWIYNTGVKTLPFPCGILGLAVLLALGIWKTDEEDLDGDGIPDRLQKPKPGRANYRQVEDWPDEVEEVEDRPKARPRS